jgi:hypothetical protein
MLVGPTRPPRTSQNETSRRSEVDVKKVVLVIVALLFLALAFSAAYSLLFGCPHAGSYRCVQGFNRETCGCPQP